MMTVVLEAVPLDLFDTETSDRGLTLTDRLSISERIRAVERTCRTIEAMARFDGCILGPSRGVVVQSDNGKRYLLEEEGGSWRITDPHELEEAVRAVDRITGSWRAALAVLGHQWSGE
jgi:hypothetical protein